uniref:KH domain-containing protein n=2 Tax=Caenorhabditis japonica TaxID=281687 RepID=A0A8R1I772_CAEJA
MMPSCTTPTFGASQLEIGSGDSPSRESVMTPTSLDDDTPRKKFPTLETGDRWPMYRRDGWSSLRAPPPARLSLSTNHKNFMSPISSAYSQTPNSLLSPAMFNKHRSIFSPTLPSTPMSYGKVSLDSKSNLFSPAPTEPVEVEATVEYLADLVKEKKHLTLFPHMFNNVERLLDDEIGRVRVALFQTEFPRVELPEPAGDMMSITEKIYVPKNEFPDYNFVGRILGPRGMTAKQLEQDTGCKIMVRGKGSMRDKSKESSHRGKANWEHLEDDLHVLVQCEDTENRVHIKLQAALEQVKKLLIPAPEGTDELKRKQLMELAIINGTYRPMKSPNPARVMTAVPLLSPTPLRSSGSVLMSPTHGNTGLPATTLGGSILSPTLTSNPLIGSNVFDYSSFINQGMFDSFNSLQLSDLTFPKYPTTTSFVNSFPSLFSSVASSAASQNMTCSPSSGDSSTASNNNTSF